ncbi:MAG: hypothetical protein AAF193_05675 [Bacteroidota bacterium]
MKHVFFFFAIAMGFSQEEPSHFNWKDGYSAEQISKIQNTLNQCPKPNSSHRFPSTHPWNSDGIEDLGPNVKKVVFIHGYFEPFQLPEKWDYHLHKSATELIVYNWNQEGNLIRQQKARLRENNNLNLDEFSFCFDGLYSYKKGKLTSAKSNNRKERYKYSKSKCISKIQHHHLKLTFTFQEENGILNVTRESKSKPKRRIWLMDLTDPTSVSEIYSSTDSDSTIQRFQFDDHPYHRASPTSSYHYVLGSMSLQRVEPKTAAALLPHEWGVS